MNLIDFKGELKPSGLIAVPPELASQVPIGEPVRVILQWGIEDEDQAWRTAGLEQFEAAYSADDSIYEQLIDESPAR